MREQRTLFREELSTRHLKKNGRTRPVPERRFTPANYNAREH